MKKCLVCETRFPTHSICCPACEAVVEMHEGFPSYAPTLAQKGGDLKLVTSLILLRWKKAISGFVLETN